MYMLLLFSSYLHIQIHVKQILNIHPCQLDGQHLDHVAMEVWSQWMSLSQSLTWGKPVSVTWPSTSTLISRSVRWTKPLMISFLRKLRYKANRDIHMKEEDKSRKTLKEKEVCMSHKRVRRERRRKIWELLRDQENVPVLQEAFLSQGFACVLTFLTIHKYCLGDWKSYDDISVPWKISTEIEFPSTPSVIS